MLSRCTTLPRPRPPTPPSVRPETGDSVMADETTAETVPADNSTAAAEEDVVEVRGETTDEAATAGTWDSEVKRAFDAQPSLLIHAV